MPPTNALARLLKLTERESKTVEPGSTIAAFKALQLSLRNGSEPW
jgi:hypothetical protein